METRGVLLTIALLARLAAVVESQVQATMTQYPSTHTPPWRLHVRDALQLGPH